MRAAAIQTVAPAGDVDANLEACERLARQAARDGADWVVLPEFFASGVGLLPRLRDEAPPADGAPLQLLRTLARETGTVAGGSALVRDDDGEVRNAFWLVGRDGEVLGRHDKDLPTMWENALYVGGDDDGVIDAGDGVAAGVALCWELMRTRTAKRLAGRVDLVVGGSGWWSVPLWHPRGAFRRMASSSARHAMQAAPRFARALGVPVVHAAHAGPLACPMPWTGGITYRGHFEGGAAVCDGDGRVLAFRHRRDGEGVVAADVQPARRPLPAPLPDRFWLQTRGALPSVVWTYQRAHGRRAYARARVAA
ncbi:carbon-nitrogen hydrolase family protein [Conexibacter sp. SYSU D00693]|uniref:carbon-nitrogen hydrolase family protein n=1 Tax=Conexibacter sp. SYSU D00693 TaxID=2812560 RepID=UPI00196B76CD|nr:carbon-nitrogen hydrolase family protein [Conexibacter sp. SYSU D00693]